MKRIFENILIIGYFIIAKVIPLLLLLGFITGIYFNLVYVQMVGHIIGLVICVPLAIGSIFGYGKYLGVW